MSIDFAVHHEGVAEGTGRWVLHVDAANNRVLLCDEDKVFYWVDIADCTMFMVHTPQQPTLVMQVQPPPQQNGLVMPEMNRQMRRNGGY